MLARSNSDLRRRRLVSALAGDFAAPRKQRGFVAWSLAAHTLLLGWLLHAPPPRLLTPSSVASATNGTSATPLYLPGSRPSTCHSSSLDSATHSSPHLTVGRQRAE